MATAKEKIVDEFDTLDIGKVQEAFDNASATTRKLKVEKPCDKNLRILPPRELALYYVEFGVHYNISDIADVPSDVFQVACLELTLNQECPVCGKVQRLYRLAKMASGTPTETKLRSLASGCRAKKRYVMGVFDMDEPKDPPVTWEVGYDTWQSLHTIINIKLKKGINMTHPTKGEVICIKFIKRDKWIVPQNMYPTGDNTPIPLEGWADMRPDLEAYVNARVFSADKLRSWLIDESDILKNIAAATSLSSSPAELSAADTTASFSELD